MICLKKIDNDIKYTFKYEPATAKLSAFMIIIKIKKLITLFITDH